MDAFENGGALSDQNFPPLSMLSFPATENATPQLSLSLPEPPLSLSFPLVDPAATYSYPASQLPPPPSATPTPQPNCSCPIFPPFLNVCCVLPKALCTPGEKICNPFLPVKPVCGCDGKTYKNRCEAQLENCLHCWTHGPCEV